uniref:TPR_REGION domain-containing protein n=1 Tax=Heterorhabditis bacteriophora TaxID=37862 RepID=A0A1I7XG31_HETBA
MDNFEDEDSETIELAPMEPIRMESSYAPSTSFNIDDNMDVSIGGVNISGMLPVTDCQESEYDVALGRFMRNEMDYDEFMRVTGGQTIEEELADGGESIEDEDYDYFIGDSSAEDCEEGCSQIQHNQQMILPKSEFTPTTGGDLPVHVRNLMHEVVADELEARRSEFPPPQEAEPERVEKEKVPRKLSKTMDALLGQANLIYARGNTQDALTMLLEVIKLLLLIKLLNSFLFVYLGMVYWLLIWTLVHQQKIGLIGEMNLKNWNYSRKLLLAMAGVSYIIYFLKFKSNIRNYESNFSLGLRPLAMRTRLQAAQLINHSQANVNFEWFHELIKTVAQYYITINDEDRAILALEAFVLRSKEFGRSAEAQHETLIGMWMAKNKFIEAGKSIFALCDGIKAVKKVDGEPAMEITLSNGTYSVEPFPPICEVEYHIEPTFGIIPLSRLVVCFIGVARRDLATPLKEILLQRDLSNPADEPYVLEIARAYYNCDAYKSTKALKDIPTAMESFEKVLQINPSHVDARINLSGLQQKTGQSDKALETLQDYDLDTCTHLPYWSQKRKVYFVVFIFTDKKYKKKISDERLLIRQADVLFEAHKKEQFVRCVRMLLTPHFYEIHRTPEVMNKKRNIRSSGCSHIFIMSYLVNSILFTPNSILSMSIMNFRSTTFQNLLYFCAIKANSWPLAFEYVRWYHTITNTSHSDLLPNNREILYKRIFNAMNYVFVNSQNVSYHRYVMRALTKGIAFMKKYEKTRTCRQETFYNIGRMFHQMSITPLAIHFYEKMYITCGMQVLAEPPPLVHTLDEEANEMSELTVKYDMRRFAAHNLALIYKSSGNEYLARRVYEQMFVLALMEDTVPVKPHELGKDLEMVVKRRLNQRLANKIVPDLGLCICVYDLLDVGVTYILPGEGDGHTRIKFRFVVFRPHVDEVIEAKVVSSNRQGLILSVQFFEDITIPAERLPEPHVFEENEQVWYWEYPSDEGESPAKLYMDPGKVVRFKVVENIFKDVKPDLTVDEAKKEKSYEIIGTMAETGLGCIAWWSAVDETVEEGDDMDEE